ncbi:hypothetical protein M408DRAFT_27133 [Serendipita vermifera MAFF 305830]|uniref:Uncharacterized protein n=1 Tax=Serendipita vermifera MAFF 305830 TaxID=933852 RepID=A0A0C2WCV7_SERVB|nr:hypothetical protein M408DRAFT_27133 [Serendipita vermifera MAFF 305830]
MEDSRANDELAKAIASSHSELLSGLKQARNSLEECKERKERHRELEEQRRLATEAYQKHAEENILDIVGKLQKLMEEQAARRRDSMRSAALEPGKLWSLLYLITMMII